MRCPFDNTGATEPSLAFALSAESLSLDDLDDVVCRRTGSSFPPPPETEVSIPEIDPTEVIAQAIRETLASQPSITVTAP